VYRAHVLYYELTDLDSHTLLHRKIPSWWIFDERRRSRSRITPSMYGPTGPLDEIPWSEDNQAEIDKGWIISASSIEELAEKCGMEPGVLTATVHEYNEFCASGEDPAFDRPAATMTPLDAPPYYAIQMWPGGPNTQGGPKRNAQAQIMSVRGEPVQGLYSAGEFGSIYGMLYPSGGGNIGECLAFGRLAGQQVSSRRRG
jgi:succinate dehydrogenase/fumarate reductase flavoprotein subunit